MHRTASSSSVLSLGSTARKTTDSLACSVSTCSSSSATTRECSLCLAVSINLATAVAVADPQKIRRPANAGLLYNHNRVAVFACLVKCFFATLNYSDFVYGEISGIPTELIPRPMSKFLLEKKLRGLKKCHFGV